MKIIIICIAHEPDFCLSIIDAINISKPYWMKGSCG